MSTFNIFNNNALGKVTSNAFADVRNIPQSNIDVETYYTSLGYNLVYLQPNPVSWSAQDQATYETVINSRVMGVLLDDVTYSISSEWETIQYPKVFSLGLISSIIENTGGGEMGAVFRSKKVWKKSGYITVSPKIRFIDVNGDGYCMEMVENILRYAVSGGKRDILGGAASTIQDFMRNAIYKAAEAAEYVADIAGNPAGAELARKVGEDAKVTYATNLDDYTTLRYSPPPLIVNIGRVFFHSDMVLTNVSFTYSKECSDAGPLYVDATLELTSRTIMDGSDTTGMMTSPVDTSQRVFFSTDEEGAFANLGGDVTRL